MDYDPFHKVQYVLTSGMIKSTHALPLPTGSQGGGRRVDIYVECVIITLYKDSFLRKKSEIPKVISFILLNLNYKCDSLHD